MHRTTPYIEKRRRRFFLILNSQFSLSLVSVNRLYCSNEHTVRIPLVLLYEAYSVRCYVFLLFRDSKWNNERATWPFQTSITTLFHPRSKEDSTSLETIVIDSSLCLDQLHRLKASFCSGIHPVDGSARWLPDNAVLILNHQHTMSLNLRRYQKTERKSQENRLHWTKQRRIYQEIGMIILI